MCNRYNIKGTTKDVAEFFRATAPTLFDVPSDDILPGYLAPGLLLNHDRDRHDSRCGWARADRVGGHLIPCAVEWWAPQPHSETYL